MKAFLLLLRERFDRERLKSVVVMHRETWYAVSKIRNDKRYVEYIDRVSDEELARGAGMDALDYLIEEERAEEKDKFNQLILFLSKDDRMDDLVKSAADREYQKQLFQEYGLENK